MTRSSRGNLPDSICSTIFSSRSIAPSKFSSASRGFDLLLMEKTEELSTASLREKARLLGKRTTVASAVRGGRAFDRARRLSPEDRTTRQKTLVDSENKRLAPVSSSANVHFRISGRCA